MKHSSALRKLSRFSFMVDDKGQYHFWSRKTDVHSNRSVNLINQNGNAILLALIWDDTEKRHIVQSRNHTIKAMVAFLEGN
jgi:NAD dependent epimerase/dehydratase family enzyme